MSILKDLIADLPKEPSRAIIVFADRIRDNVIMPVQKSTAAHGKPEEYDAISMFAIKFCVKYKIPVAFPSEGTDGYQYMRTVIERIGAARSKVLQGAVDGEVDELLLEYDTGVGETFGLARLNEDEKKKIHNHVSRLRSIIEESALSDRKKNALFERLNELAREVDAHGTRTDRFFAFMGDVAFVMGDMGIKAKPLFDEVRELIKTISRARGRQEGVSLPPGDEPFSLPPPKTQGTGEEA